MTSFPRVVWEIVAHSAIVNRLASHSAVILERQARAAGGTRWFYARSERDLRRVCAELSPGSVVSFYFDDRISLIDRDAAAEERIRSTVASTGDAVVGVMGENGFEVLVEIVAGEGELRAFLEAVPSVSQVFVGAFPARDDDGRDAVTLTLPDHDGTVRRHPH